MTDQSVPINDEYEELEEAEVDEVIEALEVLADQVNSETIRAILEDAANEVHALFHDDETESQAA
ncbi:MAG: hypothetical protein P8M30_11740 [Planctomycetaceae bacterium]|nr:hypothetical protein [Planctomycetaceae bacterium]MDC0273942.1 hypothetical protein [Planctomycetaceae bacterium]MDG2389982.1 hypothetical protein [Planctomycetaceae bacterium]